MPLNIGTPIHPVKAALFPDNRIRPLFEYLPVILPVEICDMHGLHIFHGIFNVVVAVRIDHFSTVRYLSA